MKKKRGKIASPLQEANQWRWGIAGRLEGCCCQLVAITDELSPPGKEMYKDLVNKVHDKLVNELNLQYLRRKEVIINDTNK